MIVVGVIGQKGGGGKTTISLNLAVAAAEQSLAAVVIDIDPQANAAKWRDRRESENPAVIGALQSRIKQTLETARKHGADFVVSREGKEFTGAWLKADFGTGLRLVQIGKRKGEKGGKVYLDDLIAEALNDLFQKYDVPTVSHE